MKILDFSSQKQILGDVFSNYSYFGLSVLVFFGLLILSLWAGQFLFFEPLLAFHIPSGLLINFLLILSLSVLTSIVLCLVLYQTLNVVVITKKTRIGFFSSLFGLSSGMCISCSTVGLSIVASFGSLGLSLLSFLHIYENHIRLVAIAILVITYFSSLNGISTKCKI